MKKMKIKQGTRAWENAKETRIGSSEVFDIVRYYATNDELYNCGFDAKMFKEETPFVTAWALYHKVLNDGIYKKPLLEPQFAEYGLAMESFGMRVLQMGRTNKLKKGNVFISDKLIASLDISGISEPIDAKEFDFGGGFVPMGKPFVCEQKTISPYKHNLPFKYITQAQYQIDRSKSSFYILQAMILDEDTPFERGKIVSLANTSKRKFYDYVQKKVKVQHIYFNHNEAFSRLIDVCLNRFFEDVKHRREPMPFIQVDSVQNIILSIRNNSFYNPELAKEIDLTKYIEAKKISDEAEKKRKNILQEIIEFAMVNNCSKFYSEDGSVASFSANGRFLVKEAKETEDD